jgi:F-type H+-transporting ATPase subunit a
VVQHKLFEVELFGRVIEFSNHMLMVFVAAVLMLILFPLIIRQKSMVPSGWRNFVESICVFIRDEVVRPALQENTDRFIKYLWSIFFFILIINLLGMIPTDGMLYLLSGRRWMHLGGAATANIWITGSFACLSFLMIHVSGIRQQGLWHYLKNFIPHVPFPLIPLMYVLEFFGALVKPFALAIRLFANILAGHTVIAAFLGIALASQSYTITGVTLLGCVLLSILDVFVAFLQAYIFTFLTTQFIAAAVHPDH